MYLPGITLLIESVPFMVFIEPLALSLAVSLQSLHLPSLVIEAEIEIISSWSVRKFILICHSVDGLAVGE
jgi:hypothetical protein